MPFCIVRVVFFAVTSVLPAGITVRDVNDISLSINTVSHCLKRVTISFPHHSRPQFDKELPIELAKPDVVVPDLS